MDQDGRPELFIRARNTILVRVVRS
ncbi:hypothetical protein [Streptomyces luteogriseus]|nr:hypothetical protein [Streptomyces luteogriseus]